MKTAVFVEPGKVEARELPKATIKQPTDAVLRIVRACVCGSDLWWFRGISDRKHPSAVGHEAIGVVESVGDEVTMSNQVILLLHRLRMVVGIVPLVWPVLKVTVSTIIPMKWLAIRVNIYVSPMRTGHWLKYLANQVITPTRS